MRTEVAAILVAGVGARLRPLTDEKPKALVPINGKPLLLRTLELLERHGVRRVVLATGYRADAVRAAVKGSNMDVRCCHNPRYGSTQNSVSLALCADELEGSDFFKLDGDVVFHSEVLERLESSCGSLAAAIDERRALDREAMKVLVDAGVIQRFGKDLPCERAFGESIGIERVRAAATPALFRALREAEAAGKHDLYYEDVYDRLIAAGTLEAQAVPVGDLPWCEVDTIDDLREAQQVVETLERG